MRKQPFERNDIFVTVSEKQLMDIFASGYRCGEFRGMRNYKKDFANGCEVKDDGTPIIENILRGRVMEVAIFKEGEGSHC